MPERVFGSRQRFHEPGICADRSRWRRSSPGELPAARFNDRARKSTKRNRCGHPRIGRAVVMRLVDQKPALCPPREVRKQLTAAVNLDGVGAAAHLNHALA